MTDELRIGSYNARRSLTTARKLLAKQNVLCVRASQIACDKYMDPRLTNLLARIQAISTGVDSLVEGALDGDDVSREAEALVEEFVRGA